MREVLVESARLPNGPFKALVARPDERPLMPLFRFEEAARVVFDNGGWFNHVTCKMMSPEPGNDAPPPHGPAWAWAWCMLPTGPGGQLEVLWAIGEGSYDEWCWQLVEGPRASKEGEAA